MDDDHDDETSGKYAQRHRYAPGFLAGAGRRRPAATWVAFPILS